MAGASTHSFFLFIGQFIQLIGIGIAYSNKSRKYRLFEVVKKDGKTIDTE